MGLLRMGPPEEMIMQILSEFDIPFFIETGTYHGNTARWAASHFKYVFTVEKERTLFEEACRKHAASHHISFILGDSRTELKKLAAQIHGPAIFWLDAHWSGGETFGKHDQCPVLDEIAAINTSSYDDVILIDDSRLFLSPPQPPHNIDQWPDITTVLLALQSSGKSRYVVIIEDVIIAVPLEMKPMVASYCRKVNAALWEAHARHMRTSDMKKGLALIGYYLAGKIRKTISLAMPLYRVIRNSVRRI